WKVGEVFIPAKRDKFGRRFGFARFAEVKDACELLKKIEDTWFGTYKLRANVSKYKRDEDHRREANSSKVKGEQKKMDLARERSQGVSFKEALGVGGGVVSLVTVGREKP
ncbi:hypothetical protein A2U01_0066043, partial [Trifolium medium]|nr:hypothetical protein [Trifolium medium]